MPPKGIGQSSPAASGLVPVAIYTRVSTDNQVGGRVDSCEAQAAYCRQNIERRQAEGWHEVVCLTDAAYSGSTLDRPGIRTLKRMIEAGEVKVVLVYKLERVLRSTDEWFSFRAFLNKHGCRLESVTEDLSESTPSGRLKNNLLMSVAEYERLNTAEKTRAKMHEQAKRGLWNGGNVPFGYAYDKNTQVLEPHPVEAGLIARIFDQAAKLVPLQEIANVLNAEGHRTKVRTWRRRDGAEQTIGQRIFRSDGLRHIIKNPLYRAVVRFGGREYAGKHPALVPTDLWEKANAAISPVNLRPAGRLQDRDTQNHLLKGLVHCGCCQRRLIPTDSTKHAGAAKVYRYYACGSLLKERQACPVGRISANALEKTVVSFLCEISNHRDVAAAAIQHSETLKTKERPALVAELGSIQSRLDAVAKKFRHCLQVVETGGTEVFGAELRQRAAELRAEKDQLLVAREQKRQQIDTCDTTQLTEKRILDALTRLGEVLPKLEASVQKEFVHLFVERIEVRKRVQRPRAGEVAEPARQLELTIRLHVPRLVDGLDEKTWMETRAQRSAGSARAMVINTKVDFTHAHRGDVTIIAPFERVVTIAPRETPAAKIHRQAHLIQRALRWKKLLDGGQVLDRQSLARREGVSPGHVTRMLKLTEVLPEIQAYLSEVRSGDPSRYFPLRAVGELAGLPPAQQRVMFGRMQQRYAASIA